MGYYTGSGEITGGGSAVAPFHTYLWNGFHTVYQKIDSTVTLKNGVDLSDAQAEKGECSLSSHRFTIGSDYFNAFNCKGTKKSVSFSQINGSNLYALQITNETLYAKIDDGSWVS